jgi:hypothetical protein
MSRDATAFHISRLVTGLVTVNGNNGVGHKAEYLTGFHAEWSNGSSNKEILTWRFDESVTANGEGA